MVADITKEAARRILAYMEEFRIEKMPFPDRKPMTRAELEAILAE